MWYRFGVAGLAVVTAARLREQSSVVRGVNVVDRWFGRGLSVGSADLFVATPAITQDIPEGTPPIFPFLFITIACGAISGFHCLVSSGTSSKQLKNETDAQAIGYGAMLLEGALAVMVILACCAGVGMGKFESLEVTQADGKTRIVDTLVEDAQGEAIVGRAAWRQTYQLEYVDSETGEKKQKAWKDFNLVSKINVFVDGSGNF